MLTQKHQSRSDYLRRGKAQFVVVAAMVIPSLIGAELALAVLAIGQRARRASRENPHGLMTVIALMSPK